MRLKPATMPLYQRSVYTAIAYGRVEQCLAAPEDLRERALGAERAYLFLCDDGDRLVPHPGRDATGADPTTLTWYGSTLVERVRAGHQTLATNKTALSNSDPGPGAAAASTPTC